MNIDSYGPNQVCQRTACTTDGPADHVGGAHLDPRDRDRFDGNGTSLRAVTYKVRDEFTALDRARGAFPELAEVIDVALHAALAEIQYLGDQLAHVRVDADRKVREASRRALDCEDHGKTIQQLEDQLAAANRSTEKTEKARLALLSGHQAFRNFVDEVAQMVALGRPLPDTAAVVEAIRTTLKKVDAAHTRAWGK